MMPYRSNGANTRKLMSMSYSDRPRKMSETTMRVAALHEPLYEVEAALPEAITDVRRASKELTECARAFSREMATRKSGTMQAVHSAKK